MCNEVAKYASIVVTASLARYLSRRKVNLFWRNLRRWIIGHRFVVRQNGAINLAGTVTRHAYLDLEIAYSYPSDVAGVVSLNRYETSRRLKEEKRKKKKRKRCAAELAGKVSRIVGRY